MGSGGSPQGNHTSDTAGAVVIGGVVVASGSPFVDLDAAIDAVLASGLAPATGEDAAGFVKVLEHSARKVHAAQVEVQNQIDQRSLHRVDGHSTAQIQVRHVAKLSNGEASARSKTMRMLRALPKVKAAFWAGEIGIAQIHLLARVYANPRVQGAMEQRQERFIHQAQTLHYSLFETRVREWERLIDEDGPEPANERAHHNRNAKLTQNPIDLDWNFVAGFAAMQGMQIDEIWGHYIDAEWQADWDKAVAEHGDQACVADMPRTDAQRRADALWQVFQDAAGADGTALPVGFCHNIVWSAETYEEMLRRIDGQQPEPIDPDTHVCQSIDGTPLEPTEAAVTSLLHGFRRVIIGADSVTLDAGKKRFFTGVLKTVVRVQSGTTCVWPGCCTPVSRCETDHLVEHSRGGRTNPGDGAPLCGMHNRLKQQGYKSRPQPRRHLDPHPPQRHHHRPLTQAKGRRSGAPTTPRPQVSPTGTLGIHRSGPGTYPVPSGVSSLNRAIAPPRSVGSNSS